MSVLDRGALEASPLADLHAIASELSIDSYRRLRRGDLIDAILERQSGESPEAEPEEQGEPDAAAEPTPARRRRRSGRGRSSQAEAPDEAEGVAEKGPGDEQDDGARDSEPEAERPEQEIVEGVIELLPGGSGFVRVDPPEPSDDDVYVSAAQVRRCELVTGDRVSGPRRAPRRSERFASLVRVDAVNGRPATELANGVRFDDLPLAFPDQRIGLSGSDPSLEAVEHAAPIGRGSRVTIVGPAGAGKTELLRRISAAVASVEGMESWLVLTGVRPEEIPDWREGPVAPSVALHFGASSDAQGQALEGVVEQVRRLVSRGADAAVLIDTLDGVPASVVQKALASARNVVDGGSLTVIATASAPVGGETTVIVLDRASSEGFPAIDLAGSWTIRRERLA